MLGSAVLVGCGESTGTGSDRPPSPGLSPLSSAPAPVPDAPVVIDLVSAASSGGQVESWPTTITTRAQQTRYLDRFEPRMTDELAPAIEATAVVAGRLLTATVVAVGCEVPEDVVVDRPEGRWRVVAVAAKTPPVQCLVPVTTVALVELPA